MCSIKAETPPNRWRFVLRFILRLILELLGEVVDEAVDGQADLRHSVAFAHGYATVFESVEVNGDTVGRADFVLTAVSLADGSGRIVVAGKVLGKFDIEFFCFLVELLLQGKHGNFDGCERVVQVKHDSRIVFADLFFVVCVAEECEEHAVCAEGRLDDVRNVFFVGYGVDITQILARRFHMLIKVVVGAVRNAPEFAPTEREFVFEVGRRFGIEAEFLFFVVAKFEVLVIHTEVEQPLMAEVLPVVEPFEVRSGFAEKFKFHLLEFADTEDEVARGDFVAETLADLTDSERDFLAGGALYVLEVYKYALRRFGTKIYG